MIFFFRFFEYFNQFTRIIKEHAPLHFIIILIWLIISIFYHNQIMQIFRVYEA
jgi:hypothetical protein